MQHAPWFGFAGLKMLGYEHKFATVEVFDETTTLVLEDVVFESSQPQSLFTSHLRVGGGASAALHNTTFPNSPGYHVNAVNGSVYADDQASLYMVETSEPAKPLSELPNNVTFLSRNDPELRQIQEVRARAPTLHLGVAMREADLDLTCAGTLCRRPFVGAYYQVGPVKRLWMQHQLLRRRRVSRVARVDLRHLGCR